MTSSRSRHGMATSDRPEDLLLGDPPGVVDAGEDGRARGSSRRQSGPRRSDAVRAHAATPGWALPVLDVAADRVELLLVDDRAHVGGLVQRVADLQGAQPWPPAGRGTRRRRRACRNSREPAVQLWPCRVNRMAVSTQAASHRCSSSVAASGKTMSGLLPPSSRETWARRCPGLSATCAADLGGAGEGDLVHAGVLDQRLADDRARPVTTLSTPAGRNSGADLGQQQDGQRGVLGGLEHQGVPGRQRGRDLHAGDHQRRVPRQDAGHHAERLAAGCTATGRHRPAARCP